MHRHAGVLLTVQALLVVLAPAQAWNERLLTGPSRRSDSAMVYDSGRSRIVLFSGAATTGPDTWEWDGTKWTQTFPATQPAACAGHAMAYDAGRGVVVMTRPAYGGNETWEWNGSNWAQRFPTVSPSTRFGPGMAYDAARGKIVLFGGSGASTPYSDTWTWDGTNWSQLSTPVSPPPRSSPLAYDVTRARVVLFGGFGAVYPNLLGDTWEWDGTTWTQRTPITSPPARYNHALVHDVARGRTLLYGGGYANGNNSYADTWEWDGSSWTQRSPANSPPQLMRACIAYDAARSRAVLFGGVRQYATVVDDTWQWDGNTWTLQSPLKPPAGNYLMTHDPVRARIQMFAGAALWEYDGLRWSSRSLGAYPPASSIVHDSLRGRTVAFGNGETWEWDGSSWTRQYPAMSPPALYRMAMSYDPARGRCVLFGGTDATTKVFYNETWEWDGTVWAKRNPATIPVARAWHAMAHDQARGRTVMHGGGYSSNATPYYLADTWEWDGTNWSQRAAGGPSPRGLHAMTFDSARGRTVLFGGYYYAPVVGPQIYGDTWEWDGIAWVGTGLGQAPAPRSLAAMAYDSARRETVLFSGSLADRAANDTWEYGPSYPAACSPFGAGCPGGAGTPVLGAASGSVPWLNTTFSARLDGLGGASSVAVLLGDSNALWGSLPLPLDLASVGMPGCSLYTNPLVSFPVLNVAGTAAWSLAIPNVPSWAGLSLHAQGALTSPGANPLGVVTSNACELRLGAK